MTDDDEKVGFGRPPKHSRFKAGTSGNPRGRPKLRPTLKDDFNSELSERLLLRENGRERRLSKQRALIKALMALAIKGNVRAMTAVLASVRNFDLGQTTRRKMSSIRWIWTFSTRSSRASGGARQTAIEQRRLHRARVLNHRKEAPEKTIDSCWMNI
jgi:hypothetical protein